MRKKIIKTKSTLFTLDIQIVRECDFGQRAKACSKVNKGVERDVRNRNKAIDGFLFADKWADREDKSRIRTVLENIH